MVSKLHAIFFIYARTCRGIRVFIPVLMMRFAIGVGIAVQLAACAIGESPGAFRNSQLPMYGGIDRQTNDERRAADDKLIAELIQRYGGSDAAGSALFERGDRDFLAGDYALAMKSFNQAWLLDPNNPDPYWGFAMVYDDQGKSCAAKTMIDRALSLNLSSPAGLADAGRIYTYCAVSDTAFTASDKRLLFEQAEEFYSRAVSMAPRDPNLFGSWAIAHYWQGNYADAWKMIKMQRALGGAPGMDFLNLLQAKMTEPRR